MCNVKRKVEADDVVLVVVLDHPLAHKPHLNTTTCIFTTLIAKKHQFTALHFYRYTYLIRLSQNCNKTKLSTTILETKNKTCMFHKKCTSLTLGLSSVQGAIQYNYYKFNYQIIIVYGGT